MKRWLLTDLFNTSTKLVKVNKDSLLSIFDESSKLKHNISKNIEVIKKINKLDRQSRSEETKEKVKQQEEGYKETTTPKQQETHKTRKKEIINEIISKKKGCGFYDIHT